MNTQADQAAEPPRRAGRSIGAVIAGFVAVVVLSLGTDQVLHVLKVYPPWGERMADRLFALATAYRIVYTILGSYITARLAPRRPMKHALVLGVAGLFFAGVGLVATWGKDLGPAWYSIGIVVTAMPCAWAGGKLYEMRAANAVGGSR